MLEKNLLIATPHKPVILASIGGAETRGSRELCLSQSVSGNNERQFSEGPVWKKKQAEGSQKDTQPQAYTQAYVCVHIQAHTS